MRIFALLICLLWASVAQAINEKYVSALAGGAGTGTSGSPYTLSQMVTEINGGAAAGTRYNIKADGTYTRTASDTISGSGTSTNPIVLRGYTGTDETNGFLPRTNVNGPMDTTNMPLISYNATFRMSITGTWIQLQSLHVQGNVSNPVVSIGNDSMVTRCRIINSSTNASAGGLNMSSRCVLFDSDVELTGTSNGAYAVNAASASCRVWANRLKVASTTSPPPVLILQSSAVACKNTIFGSGGVGIAMTINSGAPCIADNTIVGCVGDGIDIITGTNGLQFIVGNMITDGSANGIDMVQTSTAGFLAYNRLRGNSTAIANGGEWVSMTSFGHVTSGSGTSADYQNYGSGDFRLIPGSPATSTGIPAKTSIGALQLDQTSTGSSETSTISIQ